MKVAELQRILQAQGYTNIVADGDFGPATERAVRALQTALDVTVDGVVGAKTWKAIKVQPTGEAAADAERPLMPDWVPKVTALLGAISAFANDFMAQLVTLLSLPAFATIPPYVYWGGLGAILALWFGEEAVDRSRAIVRRLRS